MSIGDPNRGWSDPIGTFVRLQSAVEFLASAEGPLKIRIDQATSALTGLSAQSFPKPARERAERILKLREKIQRGHETKRAAKRLKSKECVALIQDILSLYEECIFDMSAEVKGIIRPKDE